MTFRHRHPSRRKLIETAEVLVCSFLTTDHDRGHAFCSLVLCAFVFSIDGKNDLNSVQDANGAATSYTYLSSGNNLFYPLTQKDPQGNQTNYAYDSNGNMTSATNNSTGKGLTYTYNHSPANAVITKITDPTGTAP